MTMMPLLMMNKRLFLLSFLLLHSIVVFADGLTVARNPLKRMFSAVNKSNHQRLARGIDDGLLQQKPYPTRSSAALQASGGSLGRKDSEPSLSSKLLAEALGTFFIVQIGTASVMSHIFSNALSLGQLANAWSVAVTIAIFLTGGISGAHLNPAITISMAVFRKNTKHHVLPYILAQLTGAMAASAVNLGLYQSTIRAFEASKSIVRSSSASSKLSAAAFGEYFGPNVSVWTALGVEALGTAILALVIFGMTNPNNKGVNDDNNKWLTPVTIGATVGALIRIFGPLTQAGFNPARDFGPRLVAWLLGGWSKSVALQQAWVYVAGPVVGALGGAFVAEKILYRNSEQ